MKRLIMAVCMIMAVGGISAAQIPMMGHGGDPEGPMTEIPPLPVGKWWRIPEVVEPLKITPEEQAKLDELFVESQRKIIELRGAWSKEKFELEQLLDKKDLDDAACTEQFKKMSDKRAGIFNERFRHVLEVRKLMGYDRFQTIKSQVQTQRSHRIKEMKEKRRTSEKAQPQPPEKPQ